jgi:hypothetical protein
LCHGTFIYICLFDGALVGGVWSVAVTCHLFQNIYLVLQNWQMKKKMAGKEAGMIVLA